MADEKQIHAALSQANVTWRSNPMWEDQGRDSDPRPIDRLYAALGLVLAEEEIRWVYVTAEFQGTDYTYKVTIWTDSFVVHATGTADQSWPTLKIERRASLSRLEVLQTPVSARDIFGSGTKRTVVKVEYPTFSVDVEDRRGDWLPDALPALMQDL